MNKALILVVEDDRPIRNLIVTTLKTHDYKYITAENGSSAILEASSHKPEIILLDLGLPDMEGVDVIKKVRTWSNVPIIVISARSEDVDKIEALDAGADDYITKPFKPSVLYAKCQAILNRSKKTKKEDKEIIWLDASKHLMYVDGEPVALPNKEYLLMELFLNNKNQLFTRSQILNKVWGYDYYGDGRAVDTYIKKLRKKLGVHSHRIQTIMKAGYTYTDEED